MSSFNASKFLRIAERRHADFMTLRDRSDRITEARDDANRYRTAIRIAARHSSSTDQVERLLALPLDAALKLRRDDVEGYPVKTRNGTTERNLTGVGFQTWQLLNIARQKLERLTFEQKKLQEEMDEQYAVFPRLVEAIRGWGHRVPEV